MIFNSVNIRQNRRKFPEYQQKFFILFHQIFYNQTNFFFLHKMFKLKKWCKKTKMCCKIGKLLRKTVFYRYRPNMRFKNQI